MTDSDVNIRIKPFPTFAEWVSRTSVDTVRWDRYNSSLQSRAQTSPGALERARQVAKRAAALDTGAIEGLYEVDRGFTFTVAFETAAWETALAQQGEAVRPLFESQLHAYDYVLDLATSTQPIAEAAIRKLHEIVCEARPTYRVMTVVGPQEQPLPKGQYKVLPNHVRTRKGVDHAYAPVEITPPEMARLVNELRSEAFLAAHPAQQAAYAHYGLVVIHRFADENGRVARALASAFTYRAISMPVLILSEQKNAYLDALESADNEDYQAFVKFMLDRSLDTIQLVADTLGVAAAPGPEESLAAIQGLYMTRGGYTHEQVDEAGKRLAEALAESFKRSVPRNAGPKISSGTEIHAGTAGAKVPAPALRSPDGGRRVHFSMSTAAPAQASISADFNVWVPRDAAGEDDLILSEARSGLALSARMEEVVPGISGALQIRLNLFAEQIVNNLLADLKAQAEKALQART
jgi:Fic family protein